jgi:hypothetical protein
LRAEGGTYKPQKHKRKTIKAVAVEAGEKPHVRNQDRKAHKAKEAKKAEKKSKHDTPKWRPLKATDVRATSCTAHDLLHTLIGICFFFGGGRCSCCCINRNPVSQCFMQVVIIPIYWNMHHEEKAQVLAAAKAATELLEEAGISVTTDAANQYTPGQKMKYWCV